MTENIFEPNFFSAALFEKMKAITPAIEDLELYEFRYGLNNLVPAEGWDSVTPSSMAEIEQRVNARALYDGIKIKPKVDDRIVLDEKILGLTQMLLVGIMTGDVHRRVGEQAFFFRCAWLLLFAPHHLFYGKDPSSFRWQSVQTVQAEAKRI